MGILDLMNKQSKMPEAPKPMENYRVKELEEKIDKIGTHLVKLSSDFSTATGRKVDDIDGLTKVEESQESRITILEQNIVIEPDMIPKYKNICNRLGIKIKSIEFVEKQDKEFINQTS